jgi:hypothetical protein
MNELWLPSDVKALLDAERGHAEMPPRAKARLARKLAPSLGAGAVGVKAMSGWKVLALKGTLLVATAGGAIALAERAPRDVPATTSAAAPPPLISVVPRAPAPTIATAEVVNAPPAPPVVVKHAAKPVVDPIADLEAERTLLDEARAALQQGDPARALDATDRHAARFARGTLTEERWALRVRALARLGRRDDARAAASEMASRFPHSFLLASAAHDAESIP